MPSVSVGDAWSRLFVHHRFLEMEHWKNMLQVFSLLVRFRSKLQEIAKLGHTAQWQEALALGGGALPFDLCSATVAACGRGLMGLDKDALFWMLLSYHGPSLLVCCTLQMAHSLHASSHEITVIVDVDSDIYLYTFMHFQAASGKWRCYSWRTTWEHLAHAAMLWYAPLPSLRVHGMWPGLLHMKYSQRCSTRGWQETISPAVLWLAHAKPPQGGRMHSTSWPCEGRMKFLRGFGRIWWFATGFSAHAKELESGRGFSGSWKQGCSSGVCSQIWSAMSLPWLPLTVLPKWKDGNWHCSCWNVCAKIK